MSIIEKGIPGKPYNVCGGIGYKLSDLLEKYKSMAKKEIKVQTDQSRTTLADSLQFWRNRLIEEI
jgi:hypothetical protein